MREKRNAYMFCYGNLKAKYHLEELGKYGKIILKRILNRMGGRGLDSSGSGQEPVSGS
jgi:hypothetical protein